MNTQSKEQIAASETLTRLEVYHKDFRHTRLQILETAFQAAIKKATEQLERSRDIWRDLAHGRSAAEPQQRGERSEHREHVYDGSLCWCGEREVAASSEPPKEERGEWTPEIAAAIYGSGAYPFCKLSEAHNAALKAERERADKGWTVAKGYLDKLLQAQATIENVVTELEALQYHVKNNQSEFAKAAIKSALRKCDVDLSALHEHDAEVRKPLVDLLCRVAAHMRAHVTNEPLRKEVEAALASVKEGNHGNPG